VLHALLLLADKQTFKSPRSERAMKDVEDGGNNEGQTGL